MSREISKGERKEINFMVEEELESSARFEASYSVNFNRTSTVASKK
jgi:hypothetical protein